MDEYLGSAFMAVARLYLTEKERLRSLETCFESFIYMVCEDV